MSPSYIPDTATMTATKPALVLIHGGWHIPSTYSKFTSCLRSAGYQVHVPRLPSMNEARPPNADLAADTALIRGYVESLINAGCTVIAIMHSYGGQVGTNALHGLSLNSRSQHADGLSGGVAHLVYMSAFALPEGTSMVSKVQEFGHEHLLPLAFDFADDDSCVIRDPKPLLLGPGVNDAEAEIYTSSLLRWNSKTMYQPVEHCAWREIPVTYIYTSQDMMVPWDYQKSMVERMQVEGQAVHTVELATGHCPNLTKTQEVVDVIMHVAVGQT